MSFISYAQNFEDVMLWRALKHVECGFYIDVGANDPEIDSVTKAFYDRGWYGINIEPVAQWFQRLEEKRPRDINLQIAAGAHRGELVIYELPDTGLSTIDKATAERHETERGYTKLEQVVPVETLTSICQRFHSAPIHFLKIDVEGAEKDVLEGLDLSIIRPWIIVVESTLPNTQIEDHMQWDPILCAANYEYVYFDGLNRYYVAYEHHDLKAHFNAPPNVFDAFISRQQFASELRAQVAEGAADAAEAILETTRKELHNVYQSNQHQWQLAEARQQHIQALLNSASWRVTAPLRWLGALALKIPGGNLANTIFRDPVGRVIRYVAHRPALTRLGLRLLKLFPNLESRLRQIRVAQIRSDFLSLNTKVSGGGANLVHQQQDARDALSLISASTTRLTADEILARIRRELVDVQVEK